MSPSPRSLLALAGLLLAWGGCAVPAASPPPKVHGQPASATPAGRALTEAGPTAEGTAASRAQVRAMLARVAAARGLPVRRDVTSRVLNREQILARIREHVEKDTPATVVEAQGEMLAALELVPAEYDFVEGAYKLIQGRIAGFYEPEDQTMYLVDDLDEDEAFETLAHELVHALQDQSYTIAPLLKYVPGESDRTTAVHALLEGDATSASLDIIVGSADNISEAMLRRMLSLSTALSKEGLTTPNILQASLTAPYADGFAFVQDRRRKGGWPAVEAAYRALPETTEQLLHADKFEAREPAIPVSAPSIGALGSGFRVALDDVMGEQSLRMMLAEWTLGSIAAQAAAGWGGDRYVVARRDGASGQGRHEVAVGLRIVLDTKEDAGELADVLSSHFGKGCRERAALGPVTWGRSGSSVAIVAGPFERTAASRATKSAGTCALAEAWAASLLKPAGTGGLTEGPRQGNKPSR